MRFATSALRFLTSTCRLLMDVCSAMLSDYLVERQLVHSTTCLVSLLFAVAIFVMADLSSAVAFARLASAMEIYMALFVVPVLYPP